jgi:hypothetical protein
MAYNDNSLCIQLTGKCVPVPQPGGLATVVNAPQLRGAPNCSPRQTHSPHAQRRHDAHCSLWVLAQAVQLFLCIWSQSEAGTLAELSPKAFKNPVPRIIRAQPTKRSALDLPNGPEHNSFCPTKGMA